MDNVDIGTTITISGSNSFTLDLNGKTLDGGTALDISHIGTGTLTITGNGTITSKSGSATGTIFLQGGSLNLLSGALENTTSSGNAIYNNGTGSVTVSGGTIYTSGGSSRTIYNNSNHKW